MDARKTGDYNPKAIGDASNGQVIAKMLLMRKTVLIPFGDNSRYDFVLDDEGKFFRIQSKTGRIKNGVMIFPTSSSSYHRGGGRNGYEGQIEYFGVYCPDNDKCYLVPVTSVPVGFGHLRVDAPKNGQEKGVRWASEYEVKNTG